MKNVILMLFAVLAITIIAAILSPDWVLTNSWLVTTTNINLWLLAIILLIFAIKTEDVKREKTALQFATAVVIFFWFQISLLWLGLLPAYFKNAPLLFPWLAIITAIILSVMIILGFMAYNFDVQEMKMSLSKTGDKLDDLGRCDHCRHDNVACHCDDDMAESITEEENRIYNEREGESA